jgi:hypothetical protein
MRRIKLGLTLRIGVVFRKLNSGLHSCLRLICELVEVEGH